MPSTTKAACLRSPALVAGLFAVFGLATVRPLAAQETPPSCLSTPALGWLDFWVGDWRVFAGGQEVGSNRIRKILDGCAVSEEWQDARGGRGNSLFYYLPGLSTWRQVWVTDRALLRGGVKEKTLESRSPEGALRFQGEIQMATGERYLDRTTLTPVSETEVHQLIEVSVDQGTTWRAVFDARYVRRP